VGNASSGPASAVALADCGETLKHRFLIEVHFYQRVEFELDCWRSKVRRGPEPIKTAMIAGTTIECADHGEGEPLLLVHAGVFADWFVPSPKARRLLVCALSECAERAMGQTRPHLTSPSRTTRAIWQVLPILELDAMHVVGHSSGGPDCFPDGDRSSYTGAQPDAHRTRRLWSVSGTGICRPRRAVRRARDGCVRRRGFGTRIRHLHAGRLRGSIARDHRADPGRAGYEQAVRESSFFFRDEVPACLQWQFVSTEEPIRQPVLILEGGDGRKVGLLS
jgi:hypothetical protein